MELVVTWLGMVIGRVLLLWLALIYRDWIGGVLLVKLLNALRTNTMFNFFYLPNKSNRGTCNAAVNVFKKI